MFTLAMRIKSFPIIFLALQANEAFASHFEFCNFNGSVVEVSETTSSDRKEGVMKILAAARSNDLSYTDCQNFIGQNHRFLLNSEKVISKDNFVEIDYRYWEDANGKAYENWEILSVKK